MKRIGLYEDKSSLNLVDCLPMRVLRACRRNMMGFTYTGLNWQK